MHLGRIQVYQDRQWEGGIRWWWWWGEGEVVGGLLELLGFRYNYFGSAGCLLLAAGRFHSRPGAHAHNLRALHLVLVDDGRGDDGGRRAERLGHTRGLEELGPLGLDEEGAGE